MTYEPLTRYLESQKGGEVPMTFGQIENVLNRPLPRSARRHQAWWANTSTHSHAESWMRIGRKTSRVDIGAERVLFVRATNEAASQNRRTETATISLEKFGAAARRILDNYVAEASGDVSAAVERAFQEAVIARRQRMLDRVRANAPDVSGSVDSVDLIREDRDAR